MEEEREKGRKRRMEGKMSIIKMELFSRASKANRISPISLFRFCSRLLYTYIICVPQLLTLLLCVSHSSSREISLDGLYLLL